MGWRLMATGGKYGIAYWLHDIQIGTTVANHTCPDCGFTGSFIVFYCNEWSAPFLFPLSVMKTYYLGECPHCKVEIDIDSSEKIDPNPVIHQFPK